MLKSRLFWKFFLSMMFVVLLTVFLSINFEKFVRKQQSPQIIQQTINQLVDFRDGLTLALEVEDFVTLTKLLAENPKYSQQILIFDEFDNEILGRKQFSLPPIKQRFNHRLSKEFSQQGIELETTVISDFGQVFYLQMQPTMLYKPWLSPRIAGTFLRVALLLIFTAIVCYFLTRMLILRINRLQQATQQLANGNYQTSIIKQINSNDELGQLEKDFYQMSQQLATSQQQRKQMLSDISHELRSPLTRMQIALALVEDKFPESRPYISRAEKETQRMGELISQIIELQKLSLYGQDENRQQIDLIKLITSIIDDANYEYQQQNKQTQLQSNLKTCLIYGNEEQLHSALENIIRNGLSHTKTDSTVKVSIVKNKQDYQIHIKDYGGGIDDKDLNDKNIDIFQPFVRLDSSRNRKTGGYGLGLSIAKTIIEQHNGTITADNHYAENGEKVGLVIRVELLIKPIL